MLSVVGLVNACCLFAESRWMIYKSNENSISWNSWHSSLCLLCVRNVCVGQLWIDFSVYTNIFVHLARAYLFNWAMISDNWLLASCCTHTYSWFQTCLFLTETELAEDDEVFYYTYGLKDFFTTIFYVLISIVVHAVIQEYVLDVSVEMSTGMIYFYMMAFSCHILHPRG